ncbi:hypothetical protein [Clostridium fessum]|uniref:hypothetical protein n=1 Tax=Clostridium fessum TaxID=2126740 RepID=UPI002FD9CE82
MGLFINLNFQSGFKLHSEVALPDDGFAATIVPVDSAEHFATFAANDNLSKAVVAAAEALFALDGFKRSPYSPYPTQESNCVNKKNIC